MYEALEKRVVYAKRLKRTHDLTGNKRLIIYYIYGQLLDGIRTHKFRVPYFYGTITTARIDLLKVHVERSYICVDTIYRSSKRIRSFECEREEIKDILDSIEGAVKLVGLEFEEFKEYSTYKNFSIYCMTKKGEVT